MPSLFITFLILAFAAGAAVLFLNTRKNGAKPARRLLSDINADDINLAILKTNTEGDILYINKAGENLFGYTREETGSLLIDSLLPAISAGEKNTASIHGIKKGGEQFPAEVTVTKEIQNHQTVMVITCREITEPVQNRLAGILSAISQINQLITREKNSKILMQKACDILVSTRSYNLVWIGVAGEGSYNVQAVAQAGSAAKYLQSVQIRWDDTPYGMGPVGMAIKTRQTKIKRIHVKDDIDFTPWTKISSEYDFKSICSIPVISGGKLFGALTVYSTDEFRFNKDEVVMLEDLAADLGFALFHIEEVAARATTEKLLSGNEAKFRKLFEQNPDGIFITTMDGEIAEINDIWLKALGYNKGEITGKNLTEAGIADQGDLLALSEKLAEHGAVNNMEFDFVSGRGKVITTLLSAGVMELGDTQNILYVVRDITEQKNIEAKFRQNEEMFRLISENAIDLISLVDNKGKRFYTSPSYTKILGFTVEELREQSPFDIVHIDDRAKMEQVFLEAINTGIGNRIEYRVKDKSGSYRMLESSCSVIRGLSGEVENLVLVARDISERKKNEEMLLQKTYHDDLTSLPNRLLFKDRLNQALIAAKREKYSLAVMFIDLDRFKIVNDTLGHSIGDILLQKVAMAIQGCLRESDTIARQGGDEFIILLPKISDTHDAITTAERIIDLFHEPFIISEQEIFITTSIGISLYPHDGKDDETLIRRADIAMYKAKEIGRAGYQLYADTMEKNIKKLVLENSIRKGLKQEEFILYYQPQVDLMTGRLCALEALLRWEHPTMGLLMPSGFISQTEESGLIVPVGEWVFREACRELRLWHDDGYNDLMMMINLSGRQFQQHGLIENITKALEEININPEYLEFEITESIIMKDINQTIGILDEFNRLGIRSAIDDFGTGYSSLNYLRKLPVHMLKIDRSFISELPHDRESSVIVSSTIALAHSLGLKVIAEGVETIEQLRFLRSQECDYAQGYLFSEPKSRQEIISLLQHRQLIEHEYINLLNEAGKADTE